MIPALKTRIANALEYRQSIAARGEVVNQASLAKAVGVREASVSNWFSGATTSLKAESATKAAAYLRVNPDYLAGTSAIMLPTREVQTSARAEPTFPAWPFKEISPKLWKSLSRAKKREIETYALGVVARHDDDHKPSGGAIASGG